MAILCVASRIVDFFIIFNVRIQQILRRVVGIQLTKTPAKLLMSFFEKILTLIKSRTIVVRLYEKVTYNFSNHLAD
jgi:hypothetical protein